MGSIRKRDDTGLLFIDFRYRGLRCREQTALPDTAANRKKVQKVLDRIDSEIAAGTFDYRQFFPGSKNAEKFDEANTPSALNQVTQVVAGTMGQTGAAQGAAGVAGTPLLRDFAETWFTEKEVEWRRSHKLNIRADIDGRLVSKFGDWEVGRITKADLLAYRADLAKVQARGKKNMLSNRRINKIMNLLRQIINEAADRFNFRTPFLNIKQLKVKRTDVEPFTLDEVRLILSSIRPDFKSYYTVRFFTGMRTGEVDGLKWKYVDFEKRLILVRETIVLGEDEYTKNDSSQRDIQMSNVVYDALKAQEKVTKDQSEYVFCTRNWTVLDNKNVTTRVWYPLLRYLDLKPRRAYQTRHTAATLWLAAGENPEWIAKQMGHTTTEMLFRVYSRFVPNMTRQDGSAFERLLMQSGTTNQSAEDVTS
ncbi:MAG: site-specific integrase [Gammaproteobacteria bacterium]|nr:site-specific integrase [Gammaproteobacteria bacterium]MBU1776993.1 site-specific integrase [Gammaproteobacteria bacterium]